MKYLKLLSQSKWYWVLILVGGLVMEAVALYYQYVLGEWPCVLCIHIRIWIAAMILISILALLIRGEFFTRIFHILTTVAAIGFVERSWQVLAVERGWIFGDCSMESGLPDWFALDKWFPLVFEVQTSCGYTPYIIMQISMAEILMATSIIALLLSFSLAIASWLRSTAPQ